MATKKKIEGLESVERSMAELVSIAVQCEAIYGEGLFGWTADRQIAKIGSNAKQAIEYKIGDELSANRKRRKEIEEKYLEPYRDVEYDPKNDVEYRRQVSRDKEYIDLAKAEKELWETKIPDFIFKPVQVKITDETTEKIKKPERTISYRDDQYKVETYLALGDLVEKGYIIEIE